MAADSELILVIAGNYDQFQRWLVQTGFNPARYKYVSTMNDLLGHHGAEVVCIGTWYDRPLASFGPWYDQITRGRLD